MWWNTSILDGVEKVLLLPFLYHQLCLDPTFLRALSTFLIVLYTVGVVVFGSLVVWVEFVVLDCSRALVVCQ